jgi:hypothetical protein
MRDSRNIASRHWSKDNIINKLLIDFLKSHDKLSFSEKSRSLFRMITSLLCIKWDVPATLSSQADHDLIAGSEAESGGGPITPDGTSICFLYFGGPVDARETKDRSCSLFVSSIEQIANGAGCNFRSSRCCGDARSNSASRAKRLWTLTKAQKHAFKAARRSVHTSDWIVIRRTPVGLGRGDFRERPGTRSTSAEDRICRKSERTIPTPNI